MAEGISIVISGVEELIAKYSMAKFEGACHAGLQGATALGTTLVKRRIAGSHHITGFLLNSITPEVTSHSQAQISAAGVSYGKFVERGTGVHGEFHSPVVPKSKAAMAWHPTTVTGVPKKSGGGDGRIVRKSTKGQEGVWMFRTTFQQNRQEIVTRFAQDFTKTLLA
jgi:hypothetical protein